MHAICDRTCKRDPICSVIRVSGALEWLLNIDIRRIDRKVPFRKSCHNLLSNVILCVSCLHLSSIYILSLIHI